MKPLKTIGFVSLGCAKNAVDLQVMAGHLRKAGFALAPHPDEADVVMVNTCAFIAPAREEAVAEILRACELKKAGRCRAVVVAGCLVQRYGAALKESFPLVDAFLGIDALDKIADVVARLNAVGRRGGIVKLPCGTPHRVFSPPEPALRFTGQAFAYLKIAEGCAHRCSYCAIPAIRGGYRSRRPKDILSEAGALVATGVRELNIVAQDPMLYGVDFKTARRRYGIVDLLKELDGLPGNFRVRVLYSYPSEITDAFLDWLNTSPRALRYVDVPLQHTVPSVLRAMARGAAVQATRQAAERIRAAVPGVTLRTTVMTGFPGETERDFRQLLSDIRNMAFDHLGVFTYSAEEGTVAAELDRRVSAGVAERRRQEILRLQKRIWTAKARKQVGRTFPALVVAPGMARLESQAPDVDGVTILRDAKGVAAPTVGTVVNVRLSAVKGYDFEGVPVP